MKSGKKNAEIYAYVAAGLYAIIIIIDVIQAIRVSDFYRDYVDNYIAFKVRNFVLCISLGIIVGVLIAQNIKLIIAGLWIMACSCVIYWGIYALEFSGVWLISGILFTMAYALLAIIVINILKGNVSARKIWFLPTILSLLSVVFGTYSILEIVAILFVGLWIKNKFKLSAQNKMNSIAKSDKLMALKRLFDDGIITKEEYEQKKEEIIKR